MPRRPDLAVSRAVPRTQPRQRRGRIVWSAAGHAQALCAKPHARHVLFHQIHQSRPRQAGIAMETSRMIMLFGMRDPVEAGIVVRLAGSAYPEEHERGG